MCEFMKELDDQRRIADPCRMRLELCGENARCESSWRIGRPPPKSVECICHEGFVKHADFDFCVPYAEAFSFPRQQRGREMYGGNVPFSDIFPYLTKNPPPLYNLHTNGFSNPSSARTVGTAPPSANLPSPTTNSEAHPQGTFTPVRRGGITSKSPIAYEPWLGYRREPAVRGYRWGRTPAA